MRKCLVVFGICLLLSDVSLRAQKAFGLHMLIDSATAYLPVLKQKQSLLSSAGASLTDVRHSFLPQVRVAEQINIGTNNSIAGSLFTYGITPSSSAGVRADNTMQSATGNAAVLYGEYELYNFGLNNAKLGYAQSLVDLQQADIDKEKYLIQLDVSRLYFSLLKTQYRLDADRQNISRYERIFSVIRALALSGLKAGADSSLALAELSRARIGYYQTEGKLNQLREQLSYFTGIASYDISPDTGSGKFRTQLPIPDLIPDTAGNPLLNYYLRKQDIFHRNETVIRKNYLPHILLSASAWARGSSIQYNDQFKALSEGLGYQRFNYLAGVTFTYNLMNGIFKKDKLAINRYQLEASEAEWQQQKIALDAASRQADNSLRTVQAGLRELPVQLRSAEAGYQQKLAQYKAGISSLIDLTNASFVLYRSQTDYIEALGDWYAALLEKAASTGNLARFIQSINQ